MQKLQKIVQETMKQKANMTTPSFPETRSDSLLLIALTSVLCSLLTASMLMTGLDIPLILLSCRIATWTGTRKPRASLSQLYWGWGIGGSLAFVASLFLPIGLMIPSTNAVIATDAFWTAIAMPAIGIICATQGRKWKDENNGRTGFGLIAFCILVSIAPTAAILAAALLPHAGVR